MHDWVRSRRVFIWIKSCRGSSSVDVDARVYP